MSWEVSLRLLPSNYKMTLTKPRQNKLFSLKSIISGVCYRKGKLTNAESDLFILETTSCNVAGLELVIFWI